MTCENCENTHAVTILDAPLMIIKENCHVIMESLIKKKEKNLYHIHL